MKQITRTLYVTLLCMLMPVVAGRTVSSEIRDTNRKQRAASAIFSDIMQTLPSGMKAKVDSASSRNSERSAPRAKGRASWDSRSSGGAAARLDGATLGNLPDDVRGQVEKAIIDIDQMNQNRQVQFKEYEKKHPGPR